MASPNHEILGACGRPKRILDVWAPTGRRIWRAAAAPPNATIGRPIFWARVGAAGRRLDAGRPLRVHFAAVTAIARPLRGGHCCCTGPVEGSKRRDCVMQYIEFPALCSQYTHTEQTQSVRAQQRQGSAQTQAGPSHSENTALVQARVQLGKVIDDDVRVVVPRPVWQRMHGRNDRPHRDDVVARAVAQARARHALAGDEKVAHVRQRQRLRAPMTVSSDGAGGCVRAPACDRAPRTGTASAARRTSAERHRRGS